MAYTSFTKMQKSNREYSGQDIGPLQPPVTWDPKGNGLKEAALRFLRESCEQLGFDPDKESEYQSRHFSGTGIRENQIPCNMQKDIERLCLESKMEYFMDSGSVMDAYSVYYCFMRIFFGEYGKQKRMVELLSEYESNGSSLLMKHRDHYSHSVYVFALGLAIYETNPYFREIFRKYYGFEHSENIFTRDQRAAHAFLKFWGMTSLFHDIGYPLELPYEQAMSYFESSMGERGKGKPYMTYRDVDQLIETEAPVREKLKELYGRDFRTLNGLLAADIFEKLGETYGIGEKELLDVLNKKPVHPEEFNYFMDHAWFSAARLFREFCDIFKPEGLTKMHVDVLSAIVMHNSMYKFIIAKYKSDNPGEPLKPERHPLAFMLMLCDELQVWDRTAYGRNTRRTLHPMSAAFEFGEDCIRAEYYYDEAEQEKIRDFHREYAKWEKEEKGKGKKPPRLKDYSDMAGKEQRFARDIEKIVDTSRNRLTVITGLKEVSRRRKHLYLSNSNFLHLYDFAISLNARYAFADLPDDADPDTMEQDFTKLSLEYQIYNIDQAANFDRYLNAIHCFYDDRPVDFDLLTAFTEEDIMLFAPMEHERWIRAHERMGWINGRDYLNLPAPEGMSPEEEKKWRNNLREQVRQHPLMTPAGSSSEQIRDHYFSLPEEEQSKDIRPFNAMLKLIRKFDGLRIYRLRGYRDE